MLHLRRDPEMGYYVEQDDENSPFLQKDGWFGSRVCWWYKKEDAINVIKATGCEYIDETNI